jgi:DNA-binding transcriptional LysR family regulator
VKGATDLRALRLFRDVVDTGSVTAAGRKQGLSQPAASRLLAGLEARLGFELFFRDRGRLVPTKDALMLAAEVERALGGFERVTSLIGDIAGFRTGQLRIVAPPSFSEAVLPDIVAAFLSDHPGVHLTIQSASVSEAYQMLAARAVDGGFVKLPVDRPDIETETVVSSSTVCVLREDHPLAGRAALAPADLRGEPLILLGAGRSSRSQIDAAFARDGVRPSVRLETHTVGSACGLAAKGLGIAIVNGLLAAHRTGKGLAARPLTPEIRQDYAWATAAGPGRSRLADAFRDAARAYFSPRE